VRLGLRRTIASPKLLALADAIMARGRHDQDAWLVAAALRQRQRLRATSSEPEPGGSPAGCWARNGEKEDVISGNVSEDRRSGHLSGEYSLPFGPRPGERLD
jgi:hypothetical protein